MMTSNERGMSLMEIVVAVGLVGLIALGSMRLMQGLNVSNKDFEKSSEVLSVHTKIKSFLISNAGCKQLVGKAAGEDIEIKGVTQEYDPATRSIKQKYGRVLFTAGLEIGKIRIDHIRLLNLESTDVDQKVGMMPVEIVMTARDKTNAFSADSRVFKRVVLLGVTMDNGVIQDCSLETSILYDTITKKICEEVLGINIDGIDCTQAVLEVEKKIKSSICDDITGEGGHFNGEYCHIDNAHVGEGCPDASELAYGFDANGRLLCR